MHKYDTHWQTDFCAFRQIAGLIARRIINNLKDGDEIEKGGRFGLIKFGSRVDIVLPKSAEITIKLKQKVIGGETVIGLLKNPGN